MLATAGIGEQLPVIAAAGAAAFAGIATVMKKSTGGSSTSAVAAKPEPEPEPIDISIPYDAASVLAYEAWKEEGAQYDDAIYQKFKGIYESKAIAEVSLKKAERDAATTLAKAEKDLAALTN